MGTANPTSVERYVLCPLYSFDCDCESVDLHEGIQIKRAPGEFRKRFDESYIVSSEQWYNPSTFDWVVSLSYHQKPVELSGANSIQNAFTEWEKASNFLVDFVTACRLHHKGSITPGPLKSAVLHSTRLLPIGYTRWTYISRNGWDGKPRYKFSQSDIDGVDRLLITLTKLRELNKLDNIGIALRRFHSAYHGDIEDRLIDQMIAFESLYIGNEQGIKHKLALRTASLIGENQELREEIFKVMKDAYRKRCNIVHVIEQVTREELRKINPITENYLRQSIRKFLALLLVGCSLDNIKKKIKELAKLDENILSNGTLINSLSQE